MKLIIDIPEETFTCLKNMIEAECVDPYSLADIIVNKGTPVSTEGDLISRDALKEDFQSRFIDCNEWIERAKDKETKIRASAVKAFIGEVLLTINNAPTVKPTFGLFKEMFCAECGKRPQVKVLIDGEQIYPQIEKGGEE